MGVDYNKILKEIEAEIAPNKGEGEIATYIPELANVDPDNYGLCLQCFDNEFYTIGNWDQNFSIQSISKVFTLAMAFTMIGEKIWNRVDVEPSGDPFNSLTLLENEAGIPRNPLINSGAIVVADILVSILDDPKNDFLALIRKIADNPNINFDPKVVASEADTGFRNASLANLLKSFGNLHNDVDKVLDFYFHQCSLSMNCFDLSKAFLVFANHGVIPHSNDKLLSKSVTKRINAIMQTCGFYDEAGEFSFRVGLPGKSGVGGGIVAIYPKEYSIAIWSPRLNPKGNSVLAMKSLELLTTKTGFSIF